MTLTEEAEHLLLHQFSKAPKIKSLIRALVKPFQDAHAEIEMLHHGRYIDNARGEALDVIGAIVGQPRNELSDDDFRPWIKVAICLNNSVGTTANIVAILTILYKRKAPVAIQEYPPNVAKFTLDHPPYPQKIIEAIIRRAVPVTTECQFMFKRPEPPLLDNISAMSSSDDNNFVPFQLDYSPFSHSYFLDFS